MPIPDFDTATRQFFRSQTDTKWISTLNLLSSFESLDRGIEFSQKYLQNTTSLKISRTYNMRHLYERTKTRHFPVLHTRALSKYCILLILLRIYCITSFLWQVSMCQPPLEIMSDITYAWFRMLFLNIMKPIDQESPWFDIIGNRLYYNLLLQARGWEPAIPLKSTRLIKMSDHLQQWSISFFQSFEKKPSKFCQTSP